MGGVVDVKCTCGTSPRPTGSTQSKLSESWQSRFDAPSVLPVLRAPNVGPRNRRNKQSVTTVGAGNENRAHFPETTGGTLRCSGGRAAPSRDGRVLRQVERREATRPATRRADMDGTSRGVRLSAHKMTGQNGPARKIQIINKLTHTKGPFAGETFNLGSGKSPNYSAAV